MEEKHRRIITANCDKLVSAINWAEIFPKLIEYQIYQKEDKNIERWKKHLDNIDNNRDIYLSIKTRGPKAFDSFILCLKEIGRDDLANILKPKENNAQIDTEKEQIIPNTNEDSEAVDDEDNAYDPDADNYHNILQKGESKPLKIHVRKSNKFMEPSSGLTCYTMTSKPRGLVLIINNILFPGTRNERKAAQHDQNNLKYLFEQMGFEVEAVENLTSHDILKKIKNFSENPKLRQVHSIFGIIMSHGDEYRDKNSDSGIYGIDNKVVAVQEILNFFTATNCPSMIRKPKVFIFQSCRGNNEQRMFELPDDVSERVAVDTNPIVNSEAPSRQRSCRDLSDMLVAFSTLPGYQSHRDTFNGSWYIQILCDVIMNHAHNTELTRLFQMTDERLGHLHIDNKNCQTSETRNIGFNRECFLNPGYF